MNPADWNPRRVLYEMQTRFYSDRWSRKLLGDWFEAWAGSLIRTVALDAGREWHVGRGHIVDADGWCSHEIDLVAADKRQIQDDPAESLVFPDDAARGIFAALRPKPIRLVVEAKEGARAPWDAANDLTKLDSNRILERCRQARAVYLCRVEGIDWQERVRHIETRLESEGFPLDRVAVIGFPYDLTRRAEADYERATGAAIEMLQSFIV